MTEYGDLVRVLHDLSSIVNQEYTVDDAARLLLTAVPQLVDVDAAGISVVDHGGWLRYVAGTTASVDELDRLQEQLQDGPCQEARSRAVPVSEVITRADRWPAEYRDRAAELGVAVVTSFPLVARERVWGALDVYRCDHRPLTDAELAAGEALARVATGYLVLASDRDELRRTQAELTRQAMRDPLTGLPHRLVFIEHLQGALSWVRRHGGYLGVLFIDLDGLKYVNDRLGHAAGDQFILGSAAAISRAVRPTDVVARAGGDEFVVLLPDLPDPDTAEEVAVRIVSAVGRASSADQRAAGARSASVGVTVTDDPDTSPDTIIAHADAAMYQAKRAGGGRSAVFDPVAYARIGGKRRLQEELAAALAGGELTIHYQPIVDLLDLRVRSVEALLRWNHPTRGLLSAGQFIHALENTDLVGEVGAWVLRTGCAQLAEWDRAVPGNAPEQLFVNLSASELARHDLTDHIRKALDSSGLDGSRLVLEITETEALTHGRAVELVVDQPRTGMGCGVAIDDFGTGHSSMSRLVQLPSDVIKIDGSFTARLFSGPEIEPIISALVHLGERLQRDIVVEGIEDQRSADALVQLGCRYGQGFHLARPAPPEELGEAFLRGRGRSVSRHNVHYRRRREPVRRSFAGMVRPLPFRATSWTSCRPTLVR